MLPHLVISQAVIFIGFVGLKQIPIWLDCMLVHLYAMQIQNSRGSPSKFMLPNRWREVRKVLEIQNAGLNKLAAYFLGEMMLNTDYSLVCSLSVK